MSDPFKSLTVVLDNDYKEYEIKNLIAAIKCLRGIADVRLNPVQFEDYDNRVRIKMELRQKLFKILDL